MYRWHLWNKLTQPRSTELRHITGQLMSYMKYERSWKNCISTVDVRNSTATFPWPHNITNVSLHFFKLVTSQSTISCSPLEQMSEPHVWQNRHRTKDLTQVIVAHTVHSSTCSVVCYPFVWDMKEKPNRETRQGLRLCTLHRFGRRAQQYRDRGLN